MATKIMNKESRRKENDDNAEDYETLSNIGIVGKIDGDTAKEKLSDLEKEFLKVEEDKNDLFFNMRHAVELGLAKDLTSEQSKNVLNNLHLETMVRRGAKRELNKHRHLRQTLTNLNLNINKAISQIEKFNESEETMSHSNSKLKADKKYKATLAKLAQNEY